MPSKKVLEISSKSMQDGGESLSAVFLKKHVPELGKSIPVECVFQAGKVFQNGGPFRDLMSETPRNAKRDERLKTSGKILYFTFDGIKFPLFPRTIFYDFIYINALIENLELGKIALEYDAFTDIEFNPDKSINCQAKAAATFVSLSKLGLLNQVKELDSFIKLYDIRSTDASDKHAQPVKRGSSIIKVGSSIQHKSWGTGKITKIDGTNLIIVFPSVGEKNLADNGV